MAPARIIVKTINVHYKGVWYRYKNSPSVVNARNTILQSSTAVRTVVLLLWRNAINFVNKVERIDLADSLVLLYYAFLGFCLKNLPWFQKWQHVKLTIIQENDYFKISQKSLCWSNWKLRQTIFFRFVSFRFWKNNVQNLVLYRYLHRTCTACTCKESLCVNCVFKYRWHALPCFKMALDWNCVTNHG